MSKKTFFLLFLIISCLRLYAQNDRFYSPSEGLSGTSIHGIYQDSKGYVWISLFSSLNRFDGYSFTVYEHKQADTTSINSSYTNVVFEDSEKRLWIGTDKGLNQFDYDKDRFRNIQFFVDNKEIAVNVKWILEDHNKSLWLVTSHGLLNYDPANKKYTIFNHRFQSNGEPSYVDYNQAIIDKKENIWIGTGNEGVLIFDTGKHQFHSIREYTGSGYIFPDRTVMAVHQTNTGQILFGTAREGIVVFDPAKASFTQSKKTDGKDILLDRGIYSMITDKKGVVWIGTEGNGIKTYDIEKNAMADVSNLIDLPGVSKSRIYCYEDRQGDLWFGIQERGIYLKMLSSKNFHTIGNSKKGQQLSHYLVSSVLKDKNDNLWVATEGGGINVQWKGQSDFKLFNRNNSGAIINDKSIVKLYEDKRGWIWIGTYFEGFYCYRGMDKPMLHYNVPGYEIESRRNYVFDFCEDSRGNLWIGSNGGGLFYFDVSKEMLTDYTRPLGSGKPEFINPYIYALEYDADSTLWIASEHGLFNWNKRKNTFKSFQVANGDLANDLVTCLKRDINGTIWIGTLAGLYRFKPENSVLQRYSTENGLCSNSIKAIETDDGNKLWISTTAGISKYDLQTNVFTNYFVSDGLPCDKYVIGSSFKDLTGKLYFGGVDGLVYFNPESIMDRKNHPNLVLTSFKIFNQEVTFNPESSGILQKNINATDTVILNYANKSFTIEFAAINFSAPEKIKYAVQMNGFDPSWQYKDSKHRYATYTNLAPGTYVFNVKSTDLEGLWPGSERRLYIVVKPPFWATWWAIFIYIAVLVTAIYYIRKIALFRISMQNELHLEHVEREKLEEINQTKMQFFANVSHEIRTPLTMLLAPLEKLINSDPNDFQKKNIGYIYRNTKRLERIVNQLLELQKIENTQLKLKARETDLVKFLKDVISLFDETALDKKIHLSFEPNCDEFIVWIDPEKMDKVMFNLISNAFKFSVSDGLITISIQKNSVKENEGTFTISVSDTGCGMNQAHLERIFDRFYQVENKATGKTTGTGIGLHLSKELVEKLHGTISVESREGFGSTFSVTLPLGKKHLAPDELYMGKATQENYSNEHKSEIENEHSPVFDQESDFHTDAGKALILLIEDDLDILNYLEDELSVSYQILKANNGTDGWSLAFERVPDLIVSDIMMPGLDGLQLCKKVKSTIETSHIPVILLTAKTSVEHEIEGLETGADEYIHKPFHPRLLKLKVDKIIEAREILKQQFSKNTSFVAKEMTVTSADEKFLQKAIDFAKENLSDAELNIEKMSSALNISRVHLYRKLKAITNQNPTEFIRTIRLKQAAYLLTQGKLNVSEIAYMVGFNSHQYFTNSFQKYFDMSPTEYIKNEKNKN